MITETINFVLLALVVYLVTVVPMNVIKVRWKHDEETGQPNIRLLPVQIRSNQSVRERI
jgi:large-conductance mechanosensitive channel